MPRKPGPNSSKYYFTDDTEQAIILYNNSTHELERNKLFNDRIQYAFNKLSENLIHRFKFYYFDIPYEDVKHETVAHLIEKLNKFTPGKGKAFSYFSIVAKNYLINQNNNNYDSFKNTEDLVAVDESRNVMGEITRSERIEDEKEFMSLFIEFVEENMKSFVVQVENKKTSVLAYVQMFNNQTECLVLDSILELFRRRAVIEVFNKKALYILIKERSGISNTQDITKTLKKVEVLYKDLFINWSKTGILSTKYLKTYNYSK